MKLEKHKKQFLKLADEQEKLYLIHHMHHFKDGQNVNHELHHCFLFSKKNMRGGRYSVIHKRNKNDVFHCIDAQFEGVLYDHKNNSFKIVPRKLTNEIIYEIKFESEDK